MRGRQRIGELQECDPAQDDFHLGCVDDFSQGIGNRPLAIRIDLGEQRLCALQIAGVDCRQGLVT